MSEEFITNQPHVAVIGMSGRFPGANSVTELWRVLKNGEETIRRFTKQELLDAGLSPSLINSPKYIGAKGVLEDVEWFDAAFFGFTPREASLLDPQHRVWLECAWHALEDAGHVPQSFHGSVGVFAGCGRSTYLLNNLVSSAATIQQLTSSAAPEVLQILNANGNDLLATRTSYKFNLSGPSISVQTACSTSLVAVASACQSLLTYQCDICLAGGVSIRLPLVQGYEHDEGSLRSPDGHCRAFDASAGGTLFSDGAGAVVLKRLQDAVRDGDEIDAVIRGTAVNNDGSDKASFTAPSVKGQTEVIAMAHASADVSPDTITYVEAHGTGTEVGDPIEVRALSKAFRVGTDKRQFCAIGSIKTNLGHLDAAAGIAGFIKAVLALKHKQIPASLHFRQPNPAIDFERSPFFVADSLTDWSADPDLPRRAGVSSFGVGGTNCHVVLEEAPHRTACAQTGSSAAAHAAPQLLTLTARSKASLSALARSYVDFLDGNHEAILNDICLSANTGRAQFEHRMAVICASTSELRGRLQGWIDGQSPHGVIASSATSSPRVAFLFSGQGCQYPGMGHELYDAEPVFRTAIDQCAETLASQMDVGLLEVLFSDAADNQWINETIYLQPALFSLQYGLLELWKAWGIEPHAVLGHSVGEIAAAHAAGVLSLDDSLKLAVERGRLMQQQIPAGRMAVIFASAQVTEQAIRSMPGKLSIAAVNGPDNVVISGAAEDLSPVLANLSQRGIESTMLNSSRPFHSGLMNGIGDQLTQLGAELRCATPQCSWVSSASGDVLDTEMPASYWATQAVNPVLFSSGVETLQHLGCDTFVEIGPHTTLLAMARSVCAPATLASLPSLKQGQPDSLRLLNSLAELYVRGMTVRWSNVYANSRGRRVRLPTYEFDRKRHWIDASTTPSPVRDEGVEPGFDHPLLGRKISAPESKDVRFESVLRPHSPAHLADHQLFNTVILPASSQLAMTLAAAETCLETATCCLEDICFLRPLVVTDDEDRRVQFVVRSATSGDASFRLISNASASTSTGDWYTISKGVISSEMGSQAGDRLRPLDVDAIQKRCETVVSGEEFYSDHWAFGDQTGRSFRWNQKIWFGNGEALSCTAHPGISEDVNAYPLYPGLIEACFQSLYCCRSFETATSVAERQQVYVPFHISRVRFFGRPRGHELWCYSKIRDSETNERHVVGDLRICDRDGHSIAEVTGFELRRLSRDAIRRPSPPNTAPGRAASESKCDESATPISELLSGTMDYEKRQRIIVDYLRRQAADITGFAEQSIDTSMTFVDVGIDSLMSVSLISRIRSDMNVHMSFPRFVEGSNIDALAASFTSS